MGRLRYVSNHIRLAVVTNVNNIDGVLNTEWLDQTGQSGPDVHIPHPFAGKSGEGIFVGIKVGTILALDLASYERWIPVSIIPPRSYYRDLTEVDESDFQDVSFPIVGEGEIVIQGKLGSSLKFANNGDFSYFNNSNEGFILTGDENSTNRCSINVSPPVEYNISQLGIKAQGIVRRDVRIEQGEDEFNEYLTNPLSEQILEEVGWDPSKKTNYTTTISQSTNSGKPVNIRNPALTENRELIYEYGRNWYVANQEKEEERFTNNSLVAHKGEDRRERRSSVLNLSLQHPNELVERVVGTLVDIFGNMVDINRNLILMPTGEGVEILKDAYEKVRHSIAFHMEINTRKGWNYRENGLKEPLKAGPDILTSLNNNRDRSRWFVDVDKEGLTKVNIPASGETGNIPRLVRYENSSTIKVDDEGNPKNAERDEKDTDKLFRNNKNKDIFLDQFGPGGIKIEGDQTLNRLQGKKTSWADNNSQKTLPEFIEAGTAFHDITETARALLKENINKNASDIFSTNTVEEGLQAVSSTINPQIPASNTLPNAGGRSLHLNLDGSLESSIGANTVDRISWILDTAGGLVFRLGRDRQGRSAIIHTDGTVALEVGGFDYLGETADDQVDTRFVGAGKSREQSLPADQKRFRAGKVVIRVRRANADQTGPDGDDQVIIVDENGITLQTSGRLNLASDMDLTLQSKGKILLDAPKVQIYGDMAKFIRRDRRNI